MLKGHTCSITGHFIVPGNVRVLISENVHIYTGFHCYVPYCFTITLGKMAIALKVFALWFHAIPQLKAY